MEQSVLTVVTRKEWYKLRRIWWLPFVLMLGALGDYYLSLRGFRLMHGATELWSKLLLDEYVFFDSIRWVFLFSGIWFAGFQIAPECTERRLRLLFHLPAHHHVLLSVMFGVGFGFLLMLFAVMTAGFWLIAFLNGFPPEMTWPMYVTTIPWFMASVVIWCATASAIAEPALLRRLCLALMGYAYFLLLTSSRGFAATDLCTHTLACLPWMAAFNASALRVKEGN